MKKVILITGGAGFIGSNFVHFFTKKNPDFKIIVLDVLTYAGNLANLKTVEHQFIHGNIADFELIKKIFKKFKPSLIVNFAAETHVDRSIKGPEEFIKTNIIGTHNLLRACKEFGIEKYLQISTDEVYGDLGSGSKDLFTEKTPLGPNCPYAASKASADILVLSYFKTYSLPVLITRCSNNYGPRQFPEKLIPFFIFQALKNKDLPLYGDGQNIRDWLFVEDHCRAIDLVLKQGKIGEVYNIGGSNEKTNLEITKIILEKLKSSKSSIVFVKDRLAHDKRYGIDASKIKNELKWDVKYPFEKWIEKTIQWYLDNKDFWSNKKNDY